MNTEIQPAGDRELKIALIGCGMRGTGAAAQALHTTGPVKLWAMADVFEQRLQGSLKALTAGADVSRGPTAGLVPKIDVPQERQFVGFDAYRQATESGVDVVLLATPPAFRPIHFEYAIRQNKHVFMEKPVAVDFPGVRQVLAIGELAKEKNLKVSVGLHRHHDPVYQETIRRIHEGVLGPIKLIRAYSNRAGAGKYVKRMPEMTEMYYQVALWYYFTWLSGDFIVEQSVHMIDVCNWAKGDYPVTAQGQGGRQVRTGTDYGHIFDHHAVEYTYADGTKLFSQNRHIPGCWNHIAHYVHGTKGIAYLSETRGGIEGATNWEMPRSTANPYQIEHDVLFDAIRNGKPHNEAEYGARSTMTAIMGRMATYSGKEIHLEDAMNSQLSRLPERFDWDAEPPTLPDENGVYPVAMPGLTEAL